MGRQSQLNHSETHGYFSIVNKRKHYLGHDKQQARVKLTELLYKNNKGESLANPEIGPLVDEFLEFKKDTCGDSTYLWYKHPLDNFLAYVGRNRKLSTLSVADVERWIAKNWTQTRAGKRMLENSQKQPRRAVKSCFAWLADTSKRISVSPFKDLKVGTYQSCDNIPSADQLKKLTKHFKDDTAFTDLLVFEQLTGSRVEETWTIRSEQVDVAHSLIRLSEDQTKGYERLSKKVTRTIILSAPALAIVKRNLKLNPSGLLIQNPNARRSDNAWTPASVRSRFRRAEEKLGFRLEHRSLRRHWATEFLKEGGSVAAGAALLGHSSPKMLLLTYQKVGQDLNHLRAEANRVKPARTRRKVNA